tara:strand:+ start:1891 stop:2163 length:273 start_codon:yes stop_codon:yes gene_type:complete
MTDKKEREANAAYQQLAQIAQQEFQANLQKAQMEEASYRFALDLGVRAGLTEASNLLEFADKITNRMDMFNGLTFTAPEPTVKEPSLIIT